MIFRKKLKTSNPDFVDFSQWKKELEVFRLPFTLSENLSESIKSYRRLCLETLKTHQYNLKASDLLEINSHYCDDLIKTLYERSLWLFNEAHPKSSTHVALVALGGYGRQEMNYHSDIDLLIIYSKKPEEYLEQLSHTLLYPLWDAGLDLGHSFRSVKETEEMLYEEMTVFTSMLDARFLAGDVRLFAELKEKMIKASKNNKVVEKFHLAKQKEKEERLKKFGGSVYLLEPNVKESEGGLRDYHLLLWYQKVFMHFAPLEEIEKQNILSAADWDALLDARSFLWKIRNAIHFRVPKKNDQLTFEHQEGIAKEFAYRDLESGILGVEQFMQNYYSQASHIKHCSEIFISAMLEKSFLKPKKIQAKPLPSYEKDFLLLDAQIALKDPQLFLQNTTLIFKMFLLSNLYGYPLHESAKRALVKALSVIPDDYSSQMAVTAGLKALFHQLTHLGATLKQMHELKFLDKVIPEFSHVLFRNQHDMYHIYTVDTHLIKAVDELCLLKNGYYDAEFPEYKKAFDSVKRVDLLAWAIFFHDIGKGKGKNHSEVGAQMAAEACARMGYSEEESHFIEFLVKSHLLMPHLSQRRDLGDENLIRQFSKSMQQEEMLHALYVLTWADIRAVGPEVWTPWKGSLLTQLYERTLEMMKNDSETSESSAQKMMELKLKIEERIQDEKLRKFTLHFVSLMPAKYYYNYNLEEVLRHASLIFEKGEEELAIAHREIFNENAKEITIYAFATPALMAKITGVMAANDLNIFSANQFINKKGWAIVTLLYTEALGNILQNEKRMKQLEGELQEVIEAKKNVAELINQRKKPSWLKKKVARLLPTKIEIDNDVSAYYTVIDIYTQNRVGLLYKIYSIFTELNLYADVSKISTKVDQVADVFYVKDIFGQKITQSDKLKKLKLELDKALNADEEYAVA